MLPTTDSQAFRDMLHQQVEKRRTFAIISHPDAGKTTLTEKLLLYGGAIRSAGSVKARKTDKHATSDWMDIEKQRGISVTSSAMQFEFDRYHINIQHSGNTSSACIPVLLDELNRAGSLHRGEIIAMSAFGGGLTTGAALLRW